MSSQIYRMLLANIFEDLPYDEVPEAFQEILELYHELENQDDKEKLDKSLADAITHKKGDHLSFCYALAMLPQNTYIPPETSKALALVIGPKTLADGCIGTPIRRYPGKGSSETSYLQKKRYDNKNFDYKPLKTMMALYRDDVDLDSLIARDKKTLDELLSFARELYPHHPNDLLIIGNKIGRIVDMSLEYLLTEGGENYLELDLFGLIPLFREYPWSEKIKGEKNILVRNPGAGSLHKAFLPKNVTVELEFDKRLRDFYLEKDIGLCEKGVQATVKTKNLEYLSTKVRAPQKFKQMEDGTYLIEWRKHTRAEYAFWDYTLSLGSFIAGVVLSSLDYYDPTDLIEWGLGIFTFFEWPAPIALGATLFYKRYNLRKTIKNKRAEVQDKEPLKEY